MGSLPTKDCQFEFGTARNPSINNDATDIIHYTGQDGLIKGWIDSDGNPQGSLISGATGPAGPTGPQGSPGNNWFSVKTYGAVGDARNLTTMGTTIGSHAVTSSGEFLPSDVGKSIFGVNLVGANSLPLGTITGYTNSSSVTVSSVGGTNSGNVAGWIGTDDTSAINTAFAAAIAAQGTLYLPQANYFVSAQVLSHSGTEFYAVRGDGMNFSRLVYPPFTFTKDFMVIGDSNATYQDFSVDDLLSIGAVVSASNGQFVTANAGQWYRVRLKDWNGTGTGGVMFYFSTDEIQATEIETAHCNTGVFIASTGLRMFRPNLGGRIGLQNFDVDCVILGGRITGTVHSIVCDLQGSTSSITLVGCEVGASGTDGGTTILFVANGNPNNLRIVGGIIGGFKEAAGGTNCTGIFITAGAIATVSDAFICSTGTGKGINNSGTFADLGGNSFLGSGGQYTGSGVVAGSGSITGTACVATNITPDINWGTSGVAGNGVSAVSGNTKLIQFTITATGTPGASPTVAILFPTAFLIAPICRLIQVGGTNFTDVTNPIISSGPSTTGVTFQFTGTPVSGHTYTFVLQSDTD